MSATEIQQVRLLVNDLIPHWTHTPHFTDGQIKTLLAMAGSVLLAAAMALEAWAASETMEIDTERIGDYSYSRRSGSNKLDLARRYRDQAAEEAEAALTKPAFGWASLRLTGRGPREL